MVPTFSYFHLFLFSFSYFFLSLSLSLLFSLLSSSFSLSHIPLDMVFKNLHLGIISFSQDSLTDITSHLSSYYSSTEDPIFPGPSSSCGNGSGSGSRSGKSMGKSKRIETQAQGHTKVVRDVIAALV